LQEEKKGLRVRTFQNIPACQIRRHPIKKKQIARPPAVGGRCSSGGYGANDSFKIQTILDMVWPLGDPQRSQGVILFYAPGF